MRKKAFIDFDSTIVNTNTAFIKTCIDLYKDKPNFIYPTKLDTECWDYSDVCPYIENTSKVEEIFGMKEFFNKLEPFENAIETLKLLQSKYQIIIVSIGSYDNISNKSAYIKDTFPFIDDFVGIVNKHCDMNKEVINMSGDYFDNNIFIDDNQYNLYSQDFAQSLIRYCYGIEKNWNYLWINEGGKRILDWTHAREVLL